MPVILPFRSNVYVTVSVSVITLPDSSDYILYSIVKELKVRKGTNISSISSIQ